VTGVVGGGLIAPFGPVEVESEPTGDGGAASVGCVAVDFDPIDAGKARLGAAA
jgi:hypothetical protein